MKIEISLDKMFDNLSAHEMIMLKERIEAKLEFYRCMTDMYNPKGYLPDDYIYYVQQDRAYTRRDIRNAFDYWESTKDNS